MSRARRWVLLALLAALTTAVFAGAEPARGMTTYAIDGWGMKAAWAYLGPLAERFERPMSDLPEGGTLVTSLPARRGWSRTEVDQVLAWVARGGHLVVFDAGGRVNPLYTELAVDVARVRPLAPLDPFAWRLHVNETATLVPEGAWSGRPPPAVKLPIAGPVPPTGAVLLASTEEGKPAAFEITHDAGDIRIVVGAPLANAWITHEGNARLLDDLSAPVLFDEWHQGYAAADVIDDTEPIRTRVEALLLHILLVYGLVVWTLGARFGVLVPRTEPRQATVARELNVLGALHEMSGHETVAMERLRSLAASEGIEMHPEEETREPTLLSLARQIGSQQRGRTHV